MRAIIQRVNTSQVEVEGKVIASIGKGLLVLLGVAPTDTESNSAAMAKKIAQLRIFEDTQGKMNLSVMESGGAAIVVSQFTLYADTHKGNRPSFIGAAAPEHASPLVDHFVGELRKHNIPTQAGEFGAHMLVDLQNEGPVTIFIEM
jgi:D-tyrosyl-tRNA(Tyr) deacylase